MSHSAQFFWDAQLQRENTKRESTMYLHVTRKLLTERMRRVVGDPSGPRAAIDRMITKPQDIIFSIRHSRGYDIRHRTRRIIPTASAIQNAARKFSRALRRANTPLPESLPRSARPAPPNLFSTIVHSDSAAALSCALHMFGKYCASEFQLAADMIRNTQSVAAAESLVALYNQQGSLRILLDLLRPAFPITTVATFLLDTDEQDIVATGAIVCLPSEMLATMPHLVLHDIPHTLRTLRGDDETERNSNVDIWNAYHIVERVVWAVNADEACTQPEIILRTALDTVRGFRRKLDQDPDYEGETAQTLYRATKHAVQSNDIHPLQALLASLEQ